MQSADQLAPGQGAVLSQIDDKQVQVSGHTDNTPVGGKLTAQFPSNWELSAARAINVVRFLSEKGGVPPQRLVASGYGEYQPIASNKSAQGKSLNRRIEIVLAPAEQAPGSRPAARSSR